MKKYYLNQKRRARTFQFLRRLCVAYDMMKIFVALGKSKPTMCTIAEDKYMDTKFSQYILQLICRQIVKSK